MEYVTNSYHSVILWPSQSSSISFFLLVRETSIKDFCLEDRYSFRKRPLNSLLQRPFGYDNKELDPLEMSFVNMFGEV